MTVFVASLFLPYTINFEIPHTRFELPEVSLPRPKDPPSSPDVTRLPSRGSISEAQPTPSLFAKFALKTPGAHLVQTPGATTDHEKIFIPQEAKPFSLTLPVATVRDPRSIARVDNHSPGWGKTFTWNQPISRAKSPPPSSVLKHNSLRDAKEKLSTQLWRAHTKYKAVERSSRAPSHERRFEEADFSVEQAYLGNGGLYNAIEAVSDSGLLTDKTWVGTLGMPTDALSAQLKSTIAEKMEDQYEALTVYVDDSDLDGHYEHYCRTILWPVFHYQIPDHPKSKAYEDHSWVFYVKVNQAFADRIVKNWKKGDIVWVHDYHLLLVPGMVRKALPDAQIGFYLHTAFPSSEIFRCLAVRRELLEGILGANMVGFQTDEYTHHFLQTCSRLLNVEATNHGVILEDGRFVHVNHIPFGLDPESLDKRRGVPEVADWVQTIAEKYKGKRILVARDKLDNIRGVRQKILAYELFLNKYPRYRDEVVLIQIATSTSEQSDLDATVADIVTRVNSVHSSLAHQPLVFLKQDIDFSQYLALLTIADSLVLTSLREGMNLTPHEFIYCQDGKYGTSKYGPVVLSEFTGAASVLGSDAMLINPWDYVQVAETIKKAIDMPADEREKRWHNLHKTITTYTATAWYGTYMKQLQHAWEEHAIRDSTSVPRLHFSTLKKQYETADNRLIVLDYEGTLASWGSPTDTVVTTPKRAVDVLNDLIADPKNTVYVMSSRMPEEMERLFRQVPGLGLIAENGCFLMEAGTDDWIELVDLKHAAEWKKSVTNILRYYEERIEGSKIEVRHASIIFDHTNAEDQATAFKQAGECANHINDASQGQNISAVPIEGALFISCAHINKSSATAMIGDNLTRLHKEKGAAMPEFLLVIGDSREDEYVFTWAHEMHKKGIRDVCTVTLGARNTGASATLTQGVTGKLKSDYIKGFS